MKYEYTKAVDLDQLTTEIEAELPGKLAHLNLYDGDNLTVVTKTNLISSNKTKLDNVINNHIK